MKLQSFKHPDVLCLNAYFSAVARVTRSNPLNNILKNIRRLIACFAPVFFTMLVSVSHTEAQESTSNFKPLNRLWDSLDMGSSHHTGLTIYDPQKNKFVFNYRDDNYFTPASNIK